LFRLTPSGEPAAVGGVPPDYFSELGQLWGNPVYDWHALENTDFAWWVARVRAQLARLDLLRIDHFRALAAHWAIPADAPDARSGAWLRTPGEHLLHRLREAFPDMPLVAEDLGVITEDVVALKTGFGLPGMRVLQFGFDGLPDNVHVPYRHVRDCVAYTGTHDNDTTLGWYASLDHDTRERVDFYLRVTAGTMPEPLIRAALGSVAQLAVVPLQDLLGLGPEARMNKPGTTVGNWLWRVSPGALTAELARNCTRLNQVFGRA
jgi:4-alpha-glucanotransferase